MIVSTEPYTDFDKNIINKIKEYAKTKNLQSLIGSIEAFEEETDLEYKTEMYEGLISSMKHLEEMDQRISKLSPKKSLNKKHNQ